MKVLVTIEPTIKNKRNKKVKQAQRKVASDKENIINAGILDFSPEQIALYSAYHDRELDNSTITGAVRLFGIDPRDLRKKTSESKFLSESEVSYFSNIAYFLEQARLEDPKYYKQFNLSYGQPKVIFAQQSADYTPQPDQVAFERGVSGAGGGVLRPIAQMVGGKINDEVAKKAGEFVKNKFGKKLRLDKQAVDKTVNASVTAAIAATGIGAPIAEAVGWVAGKIAAFIEEKVVKWIKEHGDDILALGLGLASFGVLGSSPVLVLGGLGVASIGGISGGTIAGAIAATWAFVMSLLTITASSFAITTIVAFIVTPLIVALIIFIITTSAYIVPGSPGIGSYTCVSQLKGMGIFTNGGGRASEYVSFVSPDVVVHLDNFGFANQTDSGTIDIGRSYNTFPDNELNYSQDEIISRLTELMTAYPEIDVWQAYNEPLYHGASWDWLTQSDLAVIQAGNQNGKDVCIGNFKEGYPLDPTSNDFSNYADAITTAAENANINVYLCVHEHETVENWEFNQRYNGRFTQLISEGLDLPVIVTVAGFDSQAGESDHGVGWQGTIEPMDYVDMLLEYQSAAKAAGAVGISVFQLGLSGEWESYDITPLLDLAVDCESTSQIPVGSYYSRYLDVTKTAISTDGSFSPFENSDLRTTENGLIIQYTITLRARDDVISAIRFSDSCSVIQESGTGSCPESDPVVNNPDPQMTLTPGDDPYQFTYTRTYTDSAQYRDAWVGDIVRVTFNTPDRNNQDAFASASIRVGDPPNFCPNGWPVANSGPSYHLNQGAYGTFSHDNLEAIDLGIPLGTPIYATHRGLVETGDNGNSGYGRYVTITSTCEGREVRSIYGHLDSIVVPAGTIIEQGTRIGLSGHTGYSTGPHLHYEFRYRNGGSWMPAGGRGNTWINNPPYMMPAVPPSSLGTPFFVTKPLPRECTSFTGCGSVSVP
ncbi:peptidoglycan DD-metalloendopeptidase family protein [Candidatus Woesebacteria bacterium]|nr:peptidoglycan DD-metalloendopeptidase family protein [Candidatus Woesebacteria bacterium]